MIKCYYGVRYVYEIQGDYGPIRTEFLNTTLYRDKDAAEKSIAGTWKKIKQPGDQLKGTNIVLFTCYE